MIPFQHDITIRFGDSKQIFFRVRERTWNGTAWVAGPYRDLTGCTILSQVRATTEAADPILEFTPTLGDQEDEVDGRGSVILYVADEVTRALERTLTAGVWDAQIEDAGGDVLTYIEGAVTFAKDVSRA